MTDVGRFVVLGTGGHFTFQVIKELVAQGHKPVGYIQWQVAQKKRPKNGLDIAIEIKPAPHSLPDFLQQHGVKQVSLQGDLAARIDQFAPEFLLVACWPKLIEQSALESVSGRALNLHPSLLPDYRGVDPIGEQLKNVDSNYGISLHLLSDSYDCGDIVLQQRLDIKAGASRDEIETACARLGARLFISAMQSYHRPGWQLIRQPRTGRSGE
jgi:methionyl-tRNA formyltransferase